MVADTAAAFLPTIAESSATLTGLLFVAMSVAPRQEPTSHPAVVHQVRTSAALLALTSPLAVSLFGLIPGENIGYPATAVGTIGVFYTAAGIRSILASTHEWRLVRRQVRLIILLLTTFGLEFACGVCLIAHIAPTGSFDLLGNVLVASMLIGVSRAWEIVGDRPTGLASSIAVLGGRARRHRSDFESKAPPDRPPETQTPKEGNPGSAALSQTHHPGSEISPI